MRLFPTTLFLPLLACSLTFCARQEITIPATPTKSITTTPFALPTTQASSTPFIPSQIRERVEEVVYSPNGLLVAKEFRGASSINYDRIEIQDVNDSVIWKIPFEGVILGGDGNIWIEIPAQGEQWKGEPNPSIYIFEWSRDSQYLYFCYRLFSDGYQPLMDKFDLQRIDVDTGIIEKVISGKGGMDFSFSPNQEYLIYARGQDNPRRIIIRNTGDGTEQSISNPGWGSEIQIGGFDWSPYNEYELTFLTFSENWEQIQVHFLDIKSMSTNLIIEYWREELWYDTWLSNNMLRFKTFPENEITEIDIAQPTPRIIGTATAIPTP